MKYDVIVEVNKADRIVEVEKFNPYHDSKGRFASANSAASFTHAPGKSKAHDKAIDREKVKDNPYRHMKTSELEAMEYDLTIKMNRTAEIARAGIGTKNDTVRRRAQQAERQYKDHQNQMRLVHQMMDYNSKWGNANDKNPF